MASARALDDVICLRIRVRGRVQGVWFRGATREEALRLGVVGWVRNLADGSVEALAQGPRAAIDALVSYCRHGPPSARVELVDTSAEACQGLSGFEILR